MELRLPPRGASHSVFNMSLINEALILKFATWAAVTEQLHSNKSSKENVAQWERLSYLGLSGQAADLDWLSKNRCGDSGGVGCLGGAGEAGGGSRDWRGDDDARQRGGAGLAAGLSINDADLVNGSCWGQRGRQLGCQHDGPLEQLGGRHHGRRRGRGDGDVGGCGRFWSDLMTTDSQSENCTKMTRHCWVTPLWSFDCSNTSRTDCDSATADSDTARTSASIQLLYKNYNHDSSVHRYYIS